MGLLHHEIHHQEQYEYVKHVVTMTAIIILLLFYHLFDQSQSVTVPVPTGPLIDGVRENGETIVSCGNFSLISLSLSGK